MASGKGSAEEDDRNLCGFFSPVEMTLNANAELDPTWTLSHSFYVVMRGFSFYDKKENIYRPVEPHLFPTQVRQRFVLPTISEDEIKDKSKGMG